MAVLKKSIYLMHLLIINYEKLSSKYYLLIIRGEIKSFALQVSSFWSLSLSLKSIHESTQASLESSPKSLQISGPLNIGAA